MTAQNYEKSYVVDQQTWKKNQIKHSNTTGNTSAVTNFVADNKFIGEQKKSNADNFVDIKSTASAKSVSFQVYLLSGGFS